MNTPLEKFYDHFSFERKFTKNYAPTIARTETVLRLGMLNSNFTTAEQMVGDFKTYGSEILENKNNTTKLFEEFVQNNSDVYQKFALFAVEKYCKKIAKKFIKQSKAKK
jgi:hypothetical protein